MNKQATVNSILYKIRQLPDEKIKEINDFVDFLHTKNDSTLLTQKGINKSTLGSTDFVLPEESENFNSLNEPEGSYIETSVIQLTKTKLSNSIKTLPDSFSIDELIDRLIFMEKVEEGLRDSEDGKVSSNEDVKTLIDQWLK
jgi:hypothetical protein